MSADERMQAEMDRAAEAARAWMAKNLADGGVCDFCCHSLVPGRFVTFVLSGAVVATLSVIGDDRGAGSVDFVDDRFWACCETCEPVVSKGHAAALVDHVLAHRDVERTGPFSPEIIAVVRADLLELYRAFYELEPRRVP